MTTNISGRGVRNTVSIPGTGVSYSTYERHTRSNPGGTRVGLGLVLVIAAAVVALVALIS